MRVKDLASFPLLGFKHGDCCPFCARTLLFVPFFLLVEGHNLLPTCRPCSTLARIVAQRFTRADSFRSLFDFELVSLEFRSTRAPLQHQRRTAPDLRNSTQVRVGKPNDRPFPWAPMENQEFDSRRKKIYRSRDSRRRREMTTPTAFSQYLQIDRNGAVPPRPFNSTRDKY